MEGLSNALDKAHVERAIHGCCISPTAPEISHLLFADDSFLFFRASKEEASRVKEILTGYEDLSDQSVNFQKSGILFSANVRRDKQEELANILGVHNDITNSKYLGLPTLVGRSKKRMFGFIKDRVSKKIQGWRNKPISRAAKSVLIKNVAQSILSYCMSCFILPKSLCQEVERMFNQYWWSSNTTQGRGVKWNSWDHMSMSKDRGCMGFRSLQGYNIALFGKHVWKCINHPNLLVSRVLNARYFPNGHILQAAKGQGSSYIWTGIWAAKESLKKGFRWVIGDGEHIVAVKDPWLKAKKDYCVDNLHIYDGRNEFVSSLFRPGTKMWDESKVRDMFSAADATAILAIQVPQHDVGDRVAWSRSKNGSYDVKTGYQFWYDQHIGENLVPQSGGWSRLWKLNIPQKIKIFIWRLCRNNLPVHMLLRAKGINVPSTCPMCNADIEHLLHIFFDCHFAER